MAYYDTEKTLMPTDKADDMEFSRQFIDPDLADITNTIEFKELKEEQKEEYLEKKGIDLGVKKEFITI